MTRYYSKNSDAEDLAGSVASIAIVVLVILVFVLVKAVVYIVRTFATYPQHKALWIALAIWGSCCFLSMLCISLNLRSPFPELAGASFIGLLLTCFVVDMRNRDTLLRENVNLIEEVLYTSWWS